jgi:hypothetical protein
MTEKCQVVALDVLFPVTELTGVALLRVRGVFSVKNELKFCICFRYM